MNPFYLSPSRVIVLANANIVDYPPGWYYYDETGNWTGPFRSERKAAKELLRYCYWLEHGQTRWQRIWWPLRAAFKALWRDDNSGRPSKGQGAKGAGDTPLVL